MTKHLLIAGHGTRKNGTFDPGATGFISKGEHRYMKEDLFPAMKKFLPEGHNVVFHDVYNVVDRGNIVALAAQHGATQVTEFHFDAASDASARKGHVIVQENKTPDTMDLAFRDAIKKMVDVRYNHKGHQGMSGRTNLGNANRSVGANYSYRLLELGFGTSKNDSDIMVNNVDEYAKVLVETICGSVNVPNETKTGGTQLTFPTPKPTPTKPTAKTISQMADQINVGQHGNGHDNRRKSLNISQAEYDKVAAEVNRRAGVKVAPKPAPKPKKTITQMAIEIEKGVHGQGHPNRQKSLGINDAEYKKVRDEVNKRAGASTPSKPKKSVSQMATEILQGKHGNGHANRQKSLGVNNTTYEQFKKEVNKRA
ncbi:N-acetylmuramoyl-L-alanine amidase [Alkalicoccobacillus murimartini]|uniref:Uncharacterized protein YggU (UPF0235/DUF167 family) n=1 Tax=Alkalicoccobacillus murimartini TaxID=171685 RepID=A0ABT9YPI0_9BACI|nr:N-acetylmuramoyl-L-alanine amidase [Alkalicoccobacillus murimartini]MDQ0208934.1 uncharacterized protein YggU (UPF0235/DUF167 family) [Alkalicoccobacillus murimartini]